MTGEWRSSKGERTEGGGRVGTPVERGDGLYPVCIRAVTDLRTWRWGRLRTGRGGHLLGIRRPRATQSRQIGDGLITRYAADAAPSPHRTSRLHRQYRQRDVT